MSTLELDRLLPNRNNKKVNEKKRSYLRGNSGKFKKGKGTKKCVIERKLKFEDYRNC